MYFLLVLQNSVFCFFLFLSCFLCFFFFNSTSSKNSGRLSVGSSKTWPGHKSKTEPIGTNWGYQIWSRPWWSPNWFHRLFGTERQLRGNPQQGKSGREVFNNHFDLALPSRDLWTHCSFQSQWLWRAHVDDIPTRTFRSLCPSWWSHDHAYKKQTVNLQSLELRWCQLRWSKWNRYLVDKFTISSKTQSGKNTPVN